MKFEALKTEEASSSGVPLCPPDDQVTSEPVPCDLGDELDQRRHRIHSRIVSYFNKKVSKNVFKGQPTVMKRSEIQLSNNTGKSLEEDKLFKLYQILEDLEMELLIVNNKIKSYFTGLGVRIRNIRRELRRTMDEAKTPAILANYNDKSKSSHGKRKRSIRFSKHNSDSSSSDASRPSSTTTTATDLCLSSQLKSCLKQKVTDSTKPSSPTTTVPLNGGSRDARQEMSTKKSTRTASTSPPPRRRRKSYISSARVKKLPRKMTSRKQRRAWD